MDKLTVDQLLKYTTGYKLGKSGRKRTITVPYASKLADLDMVEGLTS